MVTLTYVYPYGSLWDDEDTVADLATRGARSVTELYSEALTSLRLDNRVSELRLFFRHDPGLDDVRATVQVDPVREGFESGQLSVPTAFAERTPEVRAQMLLDAVHGIVGRLGEARGWDPGALEECRQHVLDHDLEYRWASPPKASPDRRHQAHAVFRLAPDGYGRASLVVTTRRAGSVVASSTEAVAFGTSPGFRRAAKSLRWSDKNRVSLVPDDYVPAVRGGLVSLRHADDAWAEEIEEYTSVPPVPSGDPALPALAVHVDGRGSTAPKQPPSVRFVGGGPIESHRIERFHDAFCAEMTRFCSPAGHDWWRPAGIRVLDVQIAYEAARP